MKTVSVSSVLKSSSYWQSLAGVRWQLLLALIVLWVAGWWLRQEYGGDDSNLWLVMDQLMRLGQYTILGLFGVSLLSALAVWIYFLQLVRTKKVSVQARFGDGQKAEAGWVPIAVMIAGPVVRPLLGTVQARLVFSDERVSEPVILDTTVFKPKSLARAAIRGSGQTLLHDRGIYDVEKVLISFCDMLGLVSLPCRIHYTQQLFTLPLKLDDKKIAAQPHSTEEQIHRIEIPKRVEGELVNYKEFESGDNIQRIVWKIYAKSGELVVRIPETKDPYASHLYFYVSFFHGLNKKEGAFETELLNKYKDEVRGLYEALLKNGFHVRIPQDQEVPKLAGVGDKHNELFQITAASWQNDNAPSAFVSYSKAAFVCVPSLVPAEEVQTLVSNLPESVPLIVVKLSTAIPSPFQISVKDIFFRPEKSPADKLRQPWLLSSLRRALIKNEEEIAAMVMRRDNSWMTDRVGRD